MQAFAQFMLLATLLRPGLPLPAKLDGLSEGYKYDAPPKPSGLYGPPALDEEPEASQDQPIVLDAPPPPPPPTTTTTTTTPPPPPEVTYLPPSTPEPKEPEIEEEVEVVPAPSNDPAPFVEDLPAAPSDPAPAVDMKKMMGPFMPYDFNWGVDDEESGNRFTQNERTDGQMVTGSYSVLMPNGLTQVVEYVAGPGIGFDAKVRYVEPDEIVQ